MAPSGMNVLGNDVSRTQPDGRSVAIAHLPSVDGFRAVACLMVVVHHCFVHAGRYHWPLIEVGPVAFEPSRLLSLGYIGVEFFFVVSGFCLSYPLFRSERPANWITYLKRRVGRIYPPYIIAFLLLAWTLAESPDSLLHWGFGFFFVGTMVNASFWTLCVEARWYMVFPAIYCGTRKFGVFPILAFAVVVSGSYKLTSGYLPWPHVWFLIGPIPLFLPTFVLGLWIARVSTLRASVSGGGCISVLMLRLGWAGACALVLAVTPKLPLDDFYSYARIIPASLAACTTLLLALYDPFARAILSSRFFRIIGCASYSIYLIHEPIVRYGYRWSTQFNFAPAGQFFFAQGVLLPVSVAAGLVFYAVVERPSLYLVRRLFRANTKVPSKD